MTQGLGRSLTTLVAGLLVAHVAAAADRPIRLKNRTFVPPARPARQAAPRAVRRTGERQHYLVQFDDAITPATIAALRDAGVIVLRRVPDRAVAVAAPDGFDGSAVPGVRWVGQLDASDKISRDTERDLRRNGLRYEFTVIEFFPDVSGDEVATTIARAGSSALAIPQLPEHLAVIPTSRPVIEALASSDLVAWIYPASDRLVSGAPAAICDALSDGTAVANFASEGDGWDGPGQGSFVLGYLLSTASADLPAATQARELGRAMATWSRYVQIDWKQASSATAPATVNILWGPTDHGDGYPFASNVLAHTFYPAPPGTEPLAGDMHFNDGFLWGAGDPGSTDVFSVALHELGHALGLVHSSDPDSIMYPSYQGVRTDLAQVDVDTVRALYAARVQPGSPTGLSSADVGDVAAAGSVTATAANAVTIQASGADVWGTADEFTFASRPLAGDGDVIARVDSLNAVHRWTKAGVMIRDGSDPSAPHAFMVVSGGKGLAFQRRRVFGDVSYSTEGVPGAAPYWLKLSRRGDRFDAYASPDGGSWTLIGSDTIHMSGTVLAGVALTAHLDGALAEASFSGISIVSVAPWTSQDVGHVPLVGALTTTATTMTVTGAGADIWGTADAFHYAWQPLSGDGEIVAHVLSVSNASAWSKAGVMIRASLTADSPHAFMLVSAGKGYAFQRRLAAGGESLHTGGGTGTAPAWVRLVRKGNVFSAYVSADGTSWKLVGSDTIPMGQTVYAGLAVTSHSVTAQARAVFESVEIR